MTFFSTFDTFANVCAKLMIIFKIYTRAHTPYQKVVALTNFSPLEGFFYKYFIANIFNLGKKMIFRLWKSFLIIIKFNLNNRTSS